MSSITLIEAHQAPPPTQAVYAHFRATTGRVPTLIKALANAPLILKTFAPFMDQVMSDGALDGAHKELIALTCSRINGCRYCERHLEEAALATGLDQRQIAALPADHALVFSDDQRVLIRLASEATREVRASDATLTEARSRFSDEQLVEALAVIMCFNGLDRLAATLRLDEHRAAA